MGESDMSYGDYLQLDKLLDAQSPRSDAHDEMLFIIQHQTTELWMRLLLHEIDAARARLAARDFASAFKMLARVSRIFDQMNLAWDVLRTMTPVEYSGFRDSLGSSSGFQSPQYRLIEFALGNRNRAMLKPHENDPVVLARLEAELAQPSLYDVAIEVLGDATGRDLKSGTAVERAWIEVYRDPERYWDLYELAEKLVDLEDYFRRWRFNHVTTVERIIGMKKGTGGTSGVQYLRRMLETELFPELWQLRSHL
jgi:tryptophan 2,3-dioxygenase